MYNKDEVVRIPYVLTNPEGVETEFLSDGIIEKVDMYNFLIKKTNIEDVKVGQWFLFVDNEKHICMTETGDFIWICKRNNGDGSFEVGTSVFDPVESSRLNSRIEMLLEQEIE